MINNKTKPQSKKGLKAAIRYHKTIRSPLGILILIVMFLLLAIGQYAYFLINLGLLFGIEGYVLHQTGWVRPRWGPYQPFTTIDMIIYTVFSLGLIIFGFLLLIKC